MQPSDELRSGLLDEYRDRRAYARAWRQYRRPDNVVRVGVDGRKSLEGLVQGANQRSREWQRQQLRTTGFATPSPETGHAVIRTLLELGYTPTIAHVGGHLAAVSTAYNWQGNARIAAIVGRCKRTVQRARARLEHDGLIRSELLLTGDMIDGQRAPVRHPQVVRDVSPLQRLARVRRSELAPGRRKRRRGGPSAAEVSPAPAKQQAVSAADFERWAAEHPEFSSYFGTMAEAAAKREQRKPPPNVPAEIPPAEIDAWERETERRQRREQLEREREPLPPERGPPR